MLAGGSSTAAASFCRVFPDVSRHAGRDKHVRYGQAPAAAGERGRSAYVGCLERRRPRASIDRRGIAGGAGRLGDHGPAGTCANLILTKTVTITSGRGGAGVVIAPPNGRVVTMAVVSAMLRGLTLRGADAECPVVDVPSGNLQIENCLLVGAASSAVLIRHSGTAMIIDCALDNAVGAGLIAAEGGSGSLLRCEIGPCATSGVVVTHDADPEIRQCTIRGCMGNGVYASGRAGADHSVRHSGHHDAGRCPSQEHLDERRAYHDPPGPRHRHLHHLERSTAASRTAQSPTLDARVSCWPMARRRRFGTAASNGPAAAVSR